jgi:hypothetical protein
MKSIPFVDTDWSGLTHEQIWSKIIGEYEDKQHKKKGHDWIPTYYCRLCGLESQEALEGLTGKQRNRGRKGKNKRI